MQSLYIVQSQILSLSNRPFPSQEDIRKVWRSIFGDENCFSNSARLVKTRDRVRYDDPLEGEFGFKETLIKPPLNSLPFVKGFGPVVFDVHNFRFYRGSEEDLTELTIGGEKLLKKLELAANKININNFDEIIDSYRTQKGENVDIWNVATSYPEVKRYEDPYTFDIFFLRDLFKEGLNKGVFGCDFTLKDQRMNFLYYEIGRPIYFKVDKGNDLEANGKIFLHIYPVGYMVLHFAISIRCKNELSEEETKNLLLEIRPWNEKASLIWKSRWGATTLNKLYKKTLTAIDSSLFTKPSDSLTKGRWFTFALNTNYSDWVGKSIDHHFFSRFEVDSRILNINVLRGGNTYSFDYHSSLDYFSISKKGAISGSQGKSNRHRRIRLFWKFIHITEFVLLKIAIYDDYKNLLRDETRELTSLRLNSIKKLTNKEIKRFSVFDARIPSYLAEMDKQVKRLDPFYRKVYSEVSATLEFDVLRKAVLLDLQRWEEEVAQWEHGFTTYWKKIVAPIRSILGD